MSATFFSKSDLHIQGLLPASGLKSKGGLHTKTIHLTKYSKITFHKSQQIV